ncbi:PREDICTED: receptor kinase ZmPK1 [Prunus dulcis]|uniref:PREDICTED: receptor kinase ZmPK1 n=1 Tax=Prunus dulcis TaxID=3755 RepID=A0A5E4FTU9_PRUDU|nr:PREDICTED: receptor kinase ZmPK1 [Prunus dulcis]
MVRRREAGETKGLQVCNEPWRQSFASKRWLIGLETDVDGATVWQTSTNSSSLDVERAELLNSGNLFLKDAHGRGTFGRKKGSALRALLLAALKLKLLQPFEAFPRTYGGHELPSHPAIAGVNFSSSSGGFWSCRGQLTTLAPLWIRPWVGDGYFSSIIVEDEVTTPPLVERAVLGGTCESSG